MYDRLTKFWQQVKTQEKEIFWAFCIVFLAVLGAGAFQLWILLGSREEVQFIESERPVGAVAEAAYQAEIEQASALPGLFVASKRGKKYYYPWCSGAARLKEANKIWFKSAQSAEAAGYKLASDCQ